MSKLPAEPRALLKELVEGDGPEVLEQPLRIEGMLRDFAGEHRREIAALMACWRGGVVGRLRGGEDSLLLPDYEKLAREMAEKMEGPPELARWAVESWAVALGLLKTEQAAALPEEPAAAVPASLAETVPLPPPPVPPEAPARVGRMSQAIVLPAKAEVAPLPPAVEETGAEAPPEFLARVPEPRVPEPDWDAPSRTITVYPESSPKKPSLREALKDAPEGACLVLLPGLHRENVVVRKDLHLRGEPGGEEVVLEAVSGSALILEGGHLRVTGLRLRNGAAREQRAAVEVRGGRLRLEDCDLTSASANVLEARGAEAELIMRRCHLHDGKAGGLILQEGAVAYLEKCRLYRNKLSNVVIGTGCAPTLLSCQISHSLMVGIYVNEKAGGLIEDCDIWKNFSAAIQTRRGGDPQVRYGRLSGSERHGVLLVEEGAGRFEHCLIFEHGKTGISLGQRSRGLFTNCRIGDNRAEGIDLSGGASGLFTECEIFNNAIANVSLREPAFRALRGARRLGRRGADRACAGHVSAMRNRGPRGGGRDAGGRGGADFREVSFSRRRGPGGGHRGGIGGTVQRRGGDRSRGDGAAGGGALAAGVRAVPVFAKFAGGRAGGGGERAGVRGVRDPRERRRRFFLHAEGGAADDAGDDLRESRRRADGFLPGSRAMGGGAVHGEFRRGRGGGGWRAAGIEEMRGGADARGGAAFSRAGAGDDRGHGGAGERGAGRGDRGQRASDPAAGGGDGREGGGDSRAWFWGRCGGEVRGERECGRGLGDRGECAAGADGVIFLAPPWDLGA
jgi:hypothetical protein